MSAPPSFDALWASVAESLRDVVLPNLQDAHARRVTTELIGLAHYARGLAGMPDLPEDPGRSLDVTLRATQVLNDAFRGRLPDRVDRPRLSLDREKLAAYLGRVLGKPTAITAAWRLTVGHSRAMYRVASTHGTDLVVRMEQGGVFGTSGAQEFRLMRALADLGFPIAPVRWLEEDPSVLGEPFFVMDFVAGDETADERLVGADVASSFVSCLRSLHDIDLASLDLTVPQADHATHLQIDRWLTIYRESSPSRVVLLEQAADWLHEHAPPVERMCLVHGDAGPGNFTHRDGHIVAVTDWEFAHLGDPAEDWSFCLSMRGSRTMPREQWLALFEQQAGVAMTPARWNYWEAFNLFKGACANLTCLAVFESGVNRAPNMAIIGTNLHAVFLRRLTDLIAESSQELP